MLPAAAMATKRNTRARKRPMQERSRASVDVILQATELALKADGLERLTTGRVAELAGVSVGTLYQYFPSKEAIVGELLERRFEATIALFRAALEATVTTPLDVAIGMMVRGMVEHQRDVGSRLDAPILESYATTGRLKEYRSYMQRIVELLADYFERRGAELRVGDYRTAAFVIASCAEGVSQGLAYAEWDDAHAERTVAEATALVTRYLLR
jgi:AcrR family transcriptional regulator